MGMTYNRGPAPERKPMIKLIRLAAERGVTFFDTAEVYGPSSANESLVGEALLPFRNRVVIGTKCGYAASNGEHLPTLNSRPERIRQVAEASLRRLRVESIDLFYQHRVDPSVPIEDVAGKVKDLIQEGKVRYFGLSEADADQIRLAHAIQPVTALQSEYSLLSRKHEDTVLPTVNELGIGFVAYSPIGRGYLSGEMNEHTKFADANDNRISHPLYSAQAMRANRELIEILNNYARNKDATTAQIALAWLLAQSPSIVPIPGTTKTNHLLENIGAAKKTFTHKELASLDGELSRINQGGL